MGARKILRGCLPYLSTAKNFEFEKKIIKIFLNNEEENINFLWL